jgi:hypothetical protein
MVNRTEKFVKDEYWEGFGTRASGLPEDNILPFGKPGNQSQIYRVFRAQADWTLTHES